MKNSIIKFAIAALAVLTFSLPSFAQADEKPYVVKLNWSFYAYWYQWPYADRIGLVKKWEDKMGVKIQIVEANSYGDSMDQFRNGSINAVTVTNGDAWSIAISQPGVFLVAGDYSDGNDVALSTECDTLQECVDKGVKFRYDNDSVSDMLLYACLRDINVDIRAVPAEQAAESVIVQAFDKGRTATGVTWKPFVGQIENATSLCDSSQYPGYIVDGLLVADDMPMNARKALAGIWYDVVSSMDDDEVLKGLAAVPGDELDSYKDQLSTTFRLDDPEDAIAFVSSPSFIQNMEGRVHDWLFTTGLTSRQVDSIGVKFPNGKIIGNEDNVRLKFDTTVMQMAADGNLTK